MADGSSLMAEKSGLDESSPYMAEKSGLDESSPYMAEMKRGAEWNMR